MSILAVGPFRKNMKQGYTQRGPYSAIIPVLYIVDYTHAMRGAPSSGRLFAALVV